MGLGGVGREHLIGVNKVSKVRGNTSLMESPVIEIKTNPILDEKSSTKKLQKYKQAV